MIKLYFVLILLIPITTGAYAQDTTIKKKPDTIKQLQPVLIRGYLSEQPVLSVPASVAVLSKPQLSLQPDNSFVSALNTIPGVRSEERSPGSYRLSIRGSLLRSPFGIRDVKLYYDEMPLTDAGGNTYLNAIDFNSINHIEILKGPDGSLFGANSGGVVLLNPIDLHSDTNYLSAGINGGSYGLFHENVALLNHAGNNTLNLNQAYQTYDGYRQNSAMHRNFFQLADRLRYNAKDDVRLMGFYSDLKYETPGGLTLNQYQNNPSEARQPTKTLPGAVAQKAAIYQKVLYGGVVNELHITGNIRNVLTVFGSYVDFANPFITNYGNRYEGTYGLRTYFELTSKQQRDFSWKVNLGLEWQQTNADINNYGNKLGARDTAQTLDKIHTNQHFFFTRYVADVSRKLHIETALSINFYDYKFRNVYPHNENALTDRNFTSQLMPRIALSYQVTDNFIWRASVSRGYSTPTTAEIRPTDKIINTALQAEYGWNYETGFRFRNRDETMFLDASIFYYRLNNAIVSHTNADGTSYFTNEGGTNQPGIEVYFTDWLIRQNNSDFIRGLQFNESVTLNRFQFRETKKQLTGVPGQVFVTSLQVKLPQYFYAFAQYNYTSRIPLDDANTTFAGHYDLVQAKVGWQHRFNRKSRFEIYTAADNLLNEKYSLGNDLNAFGGRYYNVAAPRNYSFGMNVVF